MFKSFTNALFTAFTGDKPLVYVGPETWEKLFNSQQVFKAETLDPAFKTMPALFPIFPYSMAMQMPFLNELEKKLSVDANFDMKARFSLSMQALKHVIQVARFSVEPDFTELFHMCLLVKENYMGMGSKSEQFIADNWPSDRKLTKAPMAKRLLPALQPIVACFLKTSTIYNYESNMKDTRNVVNALQEDLASFPVCLRQAIQILSTLLEAELDVSKKSVWKTLRAHLTQNTEEQVTHFGRDLQSGIFIDGVEYDTWLGIADYRARYEFFKEALSALYYEKFPHSKISSNHLLAVIRQVAAYWSQSGFRMVFDNILSNCLLGAGILAQKTPELYLELGEKSIQVFQLIDYKSPDQQHLGRAWVKQTFPLNPRCDLSHYCMGLFPKSRLEFYFDTDNKDVYEAIPKSLKEAALKPKDMPSRKMRFEEFIENKQQYPSSEKFFIQPTPEIEGDFDFVQWGYLLSLRHWDQHVLDLKDLLSNEVCKTLDEKKALCKKVLAREYYRPTQSKDFLETYLAIFFKAVYPNQAPKDFTENEWLVIGRKCQLWPDQMEEPGFWLDIMPLKLRFSKMEALIQEGSVEAMHYYHYEMNLYKDDRSKYLPLVFNFIDLALDFHHAQSLQNQQDETPEDELTVTRLAQ